MTKQNFKKQFPDVAKQELTFKRVEARSTVEKTVLNLVSELETGLLGYTYSDKGLKVFTSDIFKSQLDKMVKGIRLLDQSTGLTGTITSDNPFICGSEMCVRVDFGTDEGAYSCSYFKL